MNILQKIKLSSLIIAIGFIIACIFHWIMGSVFHLGYPYNTFLFIPLDTYMDFFNMLDLAHKTIGNKLDGIYMPFSYLILYPFTFLFRWEPQGFTAGSYFDSKLSYYTFMSIFIVYYIWFVNMFLKPKKNRVNITCIITLSLLIYPLIFSVDRGNTEIYVFMFTSLFVWLYYKGFYNASAIPLSIAVSMKLLPIIFIILFLSDKKYLQAIYAVLLSLIITLLSFLFFQGSLLSNIIALTSRIKAFNASNQIFDFGLAYSSTFYGALKILFNCLVSFRIANNIQYIQLMFRYYSIIAIIIGALIAFYVICIEKEPWKKVALLILSYIALPHPTGDYRLIFLLVPFYMFLILERKTRSDLYYVILFSLLFLPKHYYFFPGYIITYNKISFWFSNVSISTIINPILIGIFMLLLVRDGIINTFKTSASLHQETFKEKSAIFGK